MESENQILTTQQSLDIITKMIRQAHGNVKKNSVYLILWGLVVTLANLGMFVLMWMEYPMPYLVWLITVPAWILSIYISYRHGKNARSLHGLFPPTRRQCRRTAASSSDAERVLLIG